MTGRVRASLVLLLWPPLLACNAIHDLDPDGLPVRDGADEGDAVLDGADPLVDPESEDDPLTDPGEDCSPVTPFQATCPGNVDCPDGQDLPSTCNLTLIQFNSSVLEGAFQYRDNGVTDACASLCECPGFLKLQVDADTPHSVGDATAPAPVVSYPMGSTVDPFTITTRIVDEFLYDGQEAGLYVMQDENHYMTVDVDRSSGRTEIFIDVVIPAGGGYFHSNTIPGSTTDVTLSVQRTGETSWGYFVNGTERSIVHPFSLIVNEVGVAVGNELPGPPFPLAAALFDYVCINEP